MSLGEAMTDEQIIFLISQPRSGSTMLQAILGSHPDIHTCTEPWIALPFVYALKEEGAEFDFDGRLAEHGIKAFFKESGVDEEFYHSALNSFLTSLYHKALSNTGKRIFLDKTPRYYEITSDLIKIFPNAKFIILYRHPLAVLHSILKTWVNGEIDKLYYHSRDLLVAPVKLRNFVSRHEKEICVVKYEDLVSSPQREIKKICNYLQIEYLGEIVNYKSNVEWYFGDKNYKDKSAPDEESIDTWKNNLENKLHVNLSYYYLRELGENLVDSLGYDFSVALSHIQKYKPNENDFKIWNTMIHSKYVVSVEEQRLAVKENMKNSFIKKIYNKIMT